MEENEKRSADSREILIALSIEKGGNWDAIAAAIRRREADAAPVPNPLPKAITIIDEGEYPERLRQIPHPPFALFVDGDASILMEERILSVAGSVHPLPYSEEVSEEIGKACARKGIVLCTKFATGCGVIAATACAMAGGKVILVCLGPIKKVGDEVGTAVYREVLKAGGCAVSQIPEGAPCYEAAAKIDSSGILAGLGSALALVEAPERGSASMSAAFAVSAGKDIAVVPHRIGEGGVCNRFAAEGAVIIDDVDRFLETQFPEKKRLTPVEEGVQ